MSELQIGLICEGPTDKIMIEAALNALLPSECLYVMTQLQPEPTNPRHGNGWGGVLKWCDGFASRKQAHWSGLKDDPTLAHFDIVVIHIDADVASFAYADLNTTPKTGWSPLPMPSQDCPQAPIIQAVDYIRQTTLSWLELTALGTYAFFCIPSKNIESWLLTACQSQHPLIQSGTVECNFSIETILRTLPKKERINKSKKEYLSKAPHVTREWMNVKSICSQAQRFENDLLAFKVCQ